MRLITVDLGEEDSKEVLIRFMKNRREVQSVKVSGVAEKQRIKITPTHKCILGASGVNKVTQKTGGIELHVQPGKRGNFVIQEILPIDLQEALPDEPDETNDDSGRIETENPSSEE